MIYEVEIYESKGSNYPFGTAQVRLNAITAIIWEDSTDKAKVLLSQGGVLFVKEYEGLRDAWNGSTGRQRGRH